MESGTKGVVVFSETSLAPDSTEESSVTRGELYTRVDLVEDLYPMR